MKTLLGREVVVFVAAAVEMAVKVLSLTPWI